VIVNFPSLWQVPEKQFIGREDLFWLPLSEISAQGRSDALLRPEEPVAETAHLTAARKEKGSRRRGREREREKGEGDMEKGYHIFSGRTTSHLLLPTRPHLLPSTSSNIMTPSGD
jgi:hypothetical protein